MAILALNAAATGLRALSTKIDVIANNLANAETSAFKRSRVNFEDLMYLHFKQPGAVNGDGEPSPSGLAVGLGVKVSNTQLDLEQGSIESTGRQLDVAIQGDGFFKVKTLVGDGYAYTRNGNLFVNKDGLLVLGMGDGYRLVADISVPTGTTDVVIGQNGRIDVVKNDGSKANIGQLKITQFINPQGLKAIGGSLYQRTESSGEPLDSDPGKNGAGVILQGFLEGSNVDPVKELVSLIKTQRAFELNSQSIQSADQALQTIGNLRRF